MFYAENFPFFHVNFILQMVLIVFVKETEQVQIGLKIQIIIAVSFMIQNAVYFII